MAEESLLKRLRGKKISFVDEEEKLLKENMELMIKHSAGQLKETHKIKSLRKSIARLKTVKNESNLKEDND